MKRFTFKHAGGVHTSEQTTLKAAFTDLFAMYPGLTMAGVFGGTVERIRA